ncbi:MAG: 1-acyl-sn-glycerol-3-phosphate acyltransferase [Myxococcales bacterium]|nr:1-acyl-sn-glycerol-3-phosphate acyltransferase [Myxococcales bacterium]
MASAVSIGLLPRLTSGPAAVTRATRRLARALVFALDAFGTDEPPVEGPEQARRLAWIAENVCALHGVRVVVRGRPPEAPAVLVGNHLGYLDPPALCSVAPAIPIGKRELGSWPGIGERMRDHGVLLVDRDDPYSGARVLRRALRLLRSGVSVLTFPEGTTTRGDEVLPFKRGVFGVARRAAVPVVPVAVRFRPTELCWVGDTWFLPHYLRTTAHPSARVELHFGAPIDPSSCSPEALAEKARSWVRATLAST